MEKKIAQKSPMVLEVEPGTYAWCSCGHSTKQPYCDGSHKGTNFNPVAYKAEETKKMFFCACKQTDGQPFCDGSHQGSGLFPLQLKIDVKKEVFLCQCKQTKNKPYCDGSHRNL